MRVLYLAPWSRQRGQLSRRGFLDEEIRALADAGVDAYVLSRVAKADEDHGPLHIRAVAPDSAAERRRTLRFLRQSFGHVPLANLAGAKACYRGLLIERRAAEVIATEGIQLIHSYFGWPRGFGGLLAKVATGAPLVAGLRGSDVNVLPSFDYGSRLDPSFDRSFRRMLRGADMTVSVSEFLRRRALALGAPADRARVLFKGVRLDAFTRGRDRAEARAALGLPPRPQLLAVSGLVPNKGLQQVLSVLAKRMPAAVMARKKVPAYSQQ
jgi:glycosyltransferase involved in cell wall biosynthesis